MHHDVIRSLFYKAFSYEPTPGQREAIDKLIRFVMGAGSADTFLLKGYAGTGKTSLVGALVSLLPALHIRTVLLAPTGRAAKVLSSYSGKPAFTIHKKIYQPRTQKDGSIALMLMPNLHKNTLFIVDEASMIPDSNQSNDRYFGQVNLLDDLFSYVYQGENCKMMLVGDTAQLPPVGLAISPALNIEYLKHSFGQEFDTIELTEVVRQEEGSGILDNATAIRHKIPEEKPVPPFFNTGNTRDLIRVNGNELEELLHDSFRHSGPKQTVIITRSNKRANLYNQEVRKRILFREGIINAGDLLMVVRNNYFWLPDNSSTGFIANGDTIEVLSVKTMYEAYGFHFSDIRVRLTDYDDLPELEVKVILNTLESTTASLSWEDNQKLYEGVMADYMDFKSKRKRIEAVRNDPCFNALQVKYAYALTCHKTQGGQWEDVYLDQGYLTQDMIDTEYLRWLYTALTRATKRLFLVGFRDMMYH